MSHDLELLAKYEDEADEQAFSELVSRHLNLVYSAAIRQLNGDQHMASDVVQQVFTDLARKSKELRNHANLAGWLYTSSYYAASKVVRGEDRRRLREENERIMREIANNSDSNLNWNELRPVIDHAMHELSEEDRSALLLRFFQDKEVSEVAGVLGVTTNTARMRVERALDKLRLVLERRGITSTAAALSIILTAQSISAIPYSLGSGVASHAIAAAKISGTIGKSGAAIKWITATKAKAAVVAAIVSAAITLPFAYQYLLGSDGTRPTGLGTGSNSATTAMSMKSNATGGDVGAVAKLPTRDRKQSAGISLTPPAPGPDNSVISKATNSAPEPPTTQVQTAVSNAGVEVGSRTEPGIYGKVFLVGTPPPEIEITALGQDKVCGRLAKGPVFTRHYLVGEDHGLGNVVVYVKEGLEEKNYPLPSEKLVLDNKDCTFEPYVMGVRAGQKILMKNSDPVIHSVHGTGKVNREFDLSIPPQSYNSVIEKSFPLPEVMVRMKCDVHFWMFAYAAVFDHPFFAVTDTNGNYSIPNLPPGQYTLEAVHLKMGTQQTNYTLGKVGSGNLNFSFQVPNSK